MRNVANELRNEGFNDLMRMYVYHLSEKSEFSTEISNEVEFHPYTQEVLVRH